MSSIEAKTEELRKIFSSNSSGEERYLSIIDLGRKLAPYPDKLKTPNLQVQGCQSILYLSSTFSNEAVAKVGPSRFSGSLEPIFDPFCGGCIDNSIQSPQKGSKSGPNNPENRRGPSFATASNGKLFFQAHSDALISAGLAALLLFVYSGESPAEILKAPPLFLKELGILGSLSPSRSNGLAQIHLRIKRDALIHLDTNPASC